VNKNLKMEPEFKLFIMLMTSAVTFHIFNPNGNNNRNNNNKTDYDIFGNTISRIFLSGVGSNNNKNNNNKNEYMKKTINKNNKDSKYLDNIKKNKNINLNDVTIDESTTAI
jgi:hypothetical protein